MEKLYKSRNDPGNDGEEISTSCEVSVNQSKEKVQGKTRGKLKHWAQTNLTNDRVEGTKVNRGVSVPHEGKGRNPRFHHGICGAG
eukprot:993725-Amphidinium_carterae.1